VRFEDLKPQAIVRGVLPDCTVTVVNVQWIGPDVLELTYKDPTGRVGNVLLYRDDEPRLELVEEGRPWSFDGGRGDNWGGLAHQGAPGPRRPAVVSGMIR